jgi:hypothetical protein
MNVQLICDEMKLQSECFYNCSDDSFAGVTTSERSHTLNLGEELEALLASDEVSFENDGEQTDANQKGPAKKKEKDEKDADLYEPIPYVNLFRIRNVFNQAMNGEFFFNTGSFSGDEMLA